jgi:two-component system phosphate regulon sensor histidine kinase PhoR
MLRSLRLRFLLWSWALLLGALLFVFALLSTLLGEDLVRDAEDRARSHLSAAAWLIETHGPFRDARALEDWCAELGRRLSVRISYIVDGRVLADSNVEFGDLSRMEDHSLRPEVVAALRGETGLDRRYSATLGKEMVFAAKRFGPAADLPAGVLRASVSLSPVRARLAELKSHLLWISVPVLCLAGLLSLFLTLRMTRTIAALGELALAIGGGDFSRRIRPTPGGEFAPLASAVNAMAERIEEHVRLIEDQKGQIEAVLAGMAEGVMVLDDRGRIESCNRALTELVSLPARPVGLRPIEVFRSLAVQDAVDSLVGQAGGEAAAETRRVEIDLADGRRFNASVVPFRDQKGVRKIVIVLSDMTARLREERALKDFVANVSHQLVTPLTSIRGYAEILRDSPPEDHSKAREFFEIILRNVTHMGKVVAGMLALSRSEQAGPNQGLTAVDAGLALSRCLESVQPQAAEKRVALVSEVQNGQFRVLADQTGLIQVFQNLVENALRHSPAGATIRVTARAEDAQTLFCVEDQGPGVPGELRERVFERFFRCDPNAVNADGSAGLGLAICRQIVRNFGGEIWCERPEDIEAAGARFCFTLKTA